MTRSSLPGVSGICSASDGFVRPLAGLTDTEMSEPVTETELAVAGGTPNWCGAGAGTWTLEPDLAGSVVR
jgi:hypothetical protein